MIRSLKAKLILKKLKKVHLDCDTRVSNVEALGKIGPVTNKVIPTLIMALGDNHWEVRQSAAKAFTKIGPSAEEAIPCLIKSLSDSKARVRNSASDALVEIGESAVPFLMKALDDKDSNIRSYSAIALGKIRPISDKVVAVMLKLLDDKDSNVRKASVKTLGELGPVARESLTTIEDLLDDKDYSVRICAVEALSKIGISTEIIPALLKALDCWVAPDHYEKGNRVRLVAAKALGKIDGDTSQVVQGLLKVLQKTSSNKKLRSTVAKSLIKIGPKGKEKLYNLIVALAEEDYIIRWRAVDALGEMGLEAKDALRSLVKALDDNKNDVRFSARAALEKIAKHDYNLVRESIEQYANYHAKAWVLRDLYEDIPNLRLCDITYLIDALKDRQIKKDAIEALGQIGHRAKDAVPALLKLTKNRHVALQVVKSIQQIGKPAIPYLKKALNDEDSNIRKTAQKVLNKIDKS